MAYSSAAASAGLGAGVRPPGPYIFMTCKVEKNSYTLQIHQSLGGRGEQPEGATNYYLGKPLTDPVLGGDLGAPTRTCPQSFSGMRGRNTVLRNPRWFLPLTRNAGSVSSGLTPAGGLSTQPEVKGGGMDERAPERHRTGESRSLGCGSGSH